MNEYCLNMLAVNNELYHHGILGMHWGIRRFQPYGQGYDPKREGKETGLAARLAGQTDSYSKLYGRGSNKARAKQYAKQLGSRAKSGVNEALERLNYANDRLGENLKDAGKKAKAGLARYGAQSRGTILNARGEAVGTTKGFDSSKYDALVSGNAESLLRAAGKALSVNATERLKSISEMNFERAFKDTLGSGTAQFKSAMEQTKVKSKLFAKNASATAALLAGALDPRSSASQVIEGRTPGGSKKVIGASRQDYDRFTGLNDPRLRPLDEYRTLNNMPVSVAPLEIKAPPTHREHSLYDLTNSTWRRPTTYDQRKQGTIMTGEELKQARNKMLTTMDAPISKLSAPLNLQTKPAHDQSRFITDPYEGDRIAEMISRITLDEIQKRSPSTDIGKRSSSTDIGKRLLGL